MKIRKINIDDLETLRDLSIQTFKETFEEVNTEEDMQKYLDENLSIEKLKSELENPNSEFYFAENENEWQFGTWRTEEEIKQVVAALRQIFGGSHD